MTDPGATPQQPGPQQPGPQQPGPRWTGPPPAGLHEHLPHPPPRPSPGALAGLVLAAAVAMWAAVTGTGPGRLDGIVLGEAIEVRSGGLTAAATLLTDAGSTAAMAVLAVLVGIGCWVRGRRAEAVLVLGAMAGASLVFSGLKRLLDRPRPPAADRLVHAANESLPSGHATMSVVVVGTLVVLAWRRWGPGARVAALAAATLWIGAVGATRVYLGVHWFSDVLAGWLVGGAWLALCVLLWSRWRARRPAAPPVHHHRTGGPR